MTVFRIGSADLRAADGQVVCGRCDAQFNALDSLSESPDTAGTRIAPGQPLTTGDETATPDLSQTGAEPLWDRAPGQSAAWREDSSPFGEASSGEIPSVTVPEAGEGAWRDEDEGEETEAAAEADPEAQTDPEPGQDTESGARRVDEVSAGDDLEDTDSFEWPPDEPTYGMSDDADTGSIDDTTDSTTVQTATEPEGDAAATREAADGGNVGVAADDTDIPDPGAEHETSPDPLEGRDDSEQTLPADAAHADAAETHEAGSADLAASPSLEASPDARAETEADPAPEPNREDEADLEAALEAELNALADQAAEEWAEATGASLPGPEGPDPLIEPSDAAEDEPVDVDLDDPDLDGPDAEVAGESPEEQAEGGRVSRLDPHGTETVVLDGPVSLDEFAADVTDAEEFLASAGADGAELTDTGPDGVDIDIGDITDTLPEDGEVADEIDDSSLEFNVPEDRWDEIFAGEDAASAQAMTEDSASASVETSSGAAMSIEAVDDDASADDDAEPGAPTGTVTERDDDDRPFPFGETAEADHGQDWPLPSRDVGGSQVASPAGGETGKAPVAAVESSAEPSRGRGRLWMAAAVFLAAMLVGQWIHAHRASLLTHPRVGTVLSGVYDALGIGVEPAWQLDAFRIEESAGVQDPANPGTLRLSLRFTNAARFPQPYPLLRVTLEDRWGEAVAKRDFTPAEYAAVTAERVPAGAGTEGRVTIVDPGPTADGYRLDLCYATEAGDAYCLGDLPGR